jgi:hypothetical protein
MQVKPLVFSEFFSISCVAIVSLRPRDDMGVEFL